jgi:hypothetical protein
MVMERLELHADMRGIRGVQLMAVATGIVALSAAVVVVWYDLGGAVVLAAFGVLFVATARYFARFRASPPLVYAMDDEGLQASAYCSPTLRLQFGRRVRVRWEEVAAVRLRRKMGGWSLELVTDGTNARRVTVHPWMVGMPSSQFVAEMRRRAERVVRSERTRWP